MRVLKTSETESVSGGFFFGLLYALKAKLSYRPYGYNSYNSYGKKGH